VAACECPESGYGPWLARRHLLIDKHWSRGEGLTRVVGIALVLLGLAVILFPVLLTYISGVATNGPVPMDMDNM